MKNNNLFEKEINHEKGTTECKQCSLCGNFEKKFKKALLLKCQIVKKKLKQKLNCEDYGIYCASCYQCTQIYVRRTVNSIAKKWSAHRRN